MHRFVPALLTLSLLTPVSAARTDLVPAGVWKVTSYQFGDGISVGDDQARTWLGQTVTYSVSRVISGKNICIRPTYSSAVRGDTFFLDQYHTSLQSIGLHGPTVNVIHIGCRGRDWTRLR